jgi:hypothetical protein
MNVSKTAQRRSSITRQSPPNNPRECDNTTATRPSYDLSSVGPSQSASQVTLNHDHEEHIAIHSVINTPVLEEPVSAAIATTTTVAAAASASEPATESNTTRPRLPSGNRDSTTTTTRSSIRYSVATPAVYVLDTVTYAQAMPLHVGGSGHLVTRNRNRKRNRTRVKAEKTPLHQPIPPQSLEARALMHHLFCIRCAEIKICTGR